MTNKEALNILAVKIPKGSPDFERLYKLYDDVNYEKQIAINIFNEKWKDCNVEALETTIKMYLEDFEYRPSFGLFLDRELERYIQIKQREQEKINIKIGD